MIGYIKDKDVYALFTRGAKGMRSTTTSGLSGTGSNLIAGSRRGGMTS